MDKEQRRKQAIELKKHNYFMVGILGDIGILSAEEVGYWLNAIARDSAVTGQQSIYDTLSFLRQNSEKVKVKV